MSGFILENVQVATMPHIESENEEELPNPLLQLVHNREMPRRGSKSQNIHKILDHMVRLEKKVKVLERCIPPKTSQQRLWLGATELMDEGPSYDDSDYYPEEDDEQEEKRHSGSGRGPKGSPASKSKSPARGSPTAEEMPSRVATRPVRLEKEERSCLARLLFSRCWTGKDHGAGWKIKRRCPTEHKGSLSCPCGQIGPCKKVKAHAVPIDQMKSTGPAKKNTKATASSGGSKCSRKTTDTKNKRKNGPLQVAKSTGKPLYEKLFPCCFKDHMHNECCCRCKDNPPFTGHRKLEEEVKKMNVSKKPSAKSSATKETGRKAAYEHDSVSVSEDTGDEEGSDYYNDQSEYQTFNIRSISELSRKNHEKITHLSRKQAFGDMQIKSKRQDSRVTPHRAKKEVESNSDQLETDKQLPNKSTKSTTSFQIVLHPDVSNDQIVEPEVVSHQILKTLSTIHGPIKVEQKIVVQGTDNSVIIVTHGEACQCNLCNMLKGKMHPRELVEGLGPQVVKISTDNGCNTLINHSDGCKCDLCRVLDPVVIKNMENRTPQLENESLVMAACSKSNENENSEKSTPDQTLHSNDNQATPSAPEAKHEENENGIIRTQSLMKKSKCKSQNGRMKTKKCRCTKCRQRRRVEKLKLRLRKEMGTVEYNKILREITRPSDDDDPMPSKQRKTTVQSDSDNNGYVEPKKTKKMVSFSGDLDPLQRQEEPPGRIGLDERITKRCKLCEFVNINAKQPNEIFKRDSLRSWHGQNHNSTVYSMNASSHELPHECQLTSKSKSSENEMYRFKSEEQKCFPPGHIPRNSREKQAEEKMKDKVTEEFSHFEADNGRNDLLHGSSCSGRCRRESPGEEVNGHSAILLQEGAFPPKFVYWAPESRSNVATAHSSESYYVPDQDEFPSVNMERDESNRSSGKDTGSGGGPLQRVQIPVWFRMYPDRNSR